MAVDEMGVGGHVNSSRVEELCCVFVLNSKGLMGSVW